MKITIEGTPKEVKELLQAADSSKEQKKEIGQISIDTYEVARQLSSGIKALERTSCSKA
jgi:hypothetical protein